MSWKNWVGQSAGGNYPLRQYLGGSEHSAVFLTHTREREPGNAAIKLVSDSGGAQERLAQWRSAAAVAHPNLIRILDSGSTQVGGTNVLFVVSEYAEEDLSQILPQRALTPDETRGMLAPVLDALLFLHQKDLVHGSLKPSNILASGDRILLSSDSIRRAGESRGTLLAHSPHGAPEREYSPPADVWSLGVSLVQILTQRLPVLDPSRSADPLVPDSLPAPFLEIARNCLHRDPQRRWSTAEIILRLDPHSTAALAAIAAAKAKPKASAVPRPTPAKPAATKEAHVPVKVSPVSPVEPLPEKERRAAQRIASAPSRAGAPSGSRYALPLAIAAVLLLAVFGVAKWMRQDSASSHAVSAAPDSQAVKPPAKLSADSSVPKKPEPAQPESRKPSEAARAQKPADASLQPASDKQPVRSEPPPLPAPAKTTKVSGASRGEVLEQVLPQVSQKARDTIQGVIRIAVKVHVDESGAVSGAELDAPSSSKYFSDQALQAAKRWTFEPPELEGRPVASDWRLRFDFSPAGTRVTPSQLTR